MRRFIAALVVSQPLFDRGIADENKVASPHRKAAMNRRTPKNYRLEALCLADHILKDDAPNAQRAP
ncbi:MAG: hypothetical protein CMJ78_10055 [Planctomycetaceae bacterium]|nr:hypothetical protein [Planctomycetaceae bacterium]